MEKSQYELCLEVLRRLAKAKVLDEVILVGSWCLLFYREYFHGLPYFPTIRTRDMDLLIPAPAQLPAKGDLPALLKNLGFICDFVAVAEFSQQPLIKLVHPALIVELLIPQKGSGQEQPYPIPQLKMTAQVLPFLHLLTSNTIEVKIEEELVIRLPHPATFGVHKLLVSTLRPAHMKEKKEKDLEQASLVLLSLATKHEEEKIKLAFQSLSVKAKTAVLKMLQSQQRDDLLRLCQNI